MFFVSVRPDRVINCGVPHVVNSVFEPFIKAVIGKALPLLDNLFYKYASPSYSNSPLPPSCSTNGHDSMQRAFPSMPHWSTSDDIGDGACLLRANSRHVHESPDQHVQFGMSSCRTLPQTISFSQCILKSDSITSNHRCKAKEHNHIVHSNEYIATIPHPRAYAGYVEIAPAHNCMVLPSMSSFTGAACLQFHTNRLQIACTF